jgi:hypothetical protein
LVTRLITEVGGACRAIAEDLGGDVATVKDTDPAARSKALCDLARERIVAKSLGKDFISVSFQPPICTVDTGVQGACEVECSGSMSCAITPADVVARCDPGKLSGACSADCTGSCDGSAQLAAACEGECAGICEGACSGTCTAKDGSGECRGTCSGGTCKGTCRGSCKVDPNAKVACNAACTGGCSVALAAPRCTAELGPPKAAGNAHPDCAAHCKASASAKAICAEPAVSIVPTADVDARALGSLQANLPKLIGILDGKLALVAANAQAVEDGGNHLAESREITVSVHAAACIVPAVGAIFQAVDSIKASGEAALRVLATVGVD